MLAPVDDLAATRTTQHGAESEPQLEPEPELEPEPQKQEPNLVSEPLQESELEPQHGHAQEYSHAEVPPVEDVPASSLEIHDESVSSPHGVGFGEAAERRLLALAKQILEQRLQTRSSRALTASDVLSWSVEEAQAWMGEMDVSEQVRARALEEDVDGALLLEMDKADWVELGLTGLKATRVISRAKKYLSRQ